MVKKTKFYVVWRGRNPGIYNSWADCVAQVKDYEYPQFKSFETLEQAIEAYRGSPKDFLAPKSINNLGLDTRTTITSDQPIPNSICVDASCLGNPGKMEYRGVDFETGKEIFRKGVFENATQNLGEFLAIVHGLTYLKSNNLNKVLYTDSTTAMTWVRNQKVKTTLTKTPENALLFDWIDKAIKWLSLNTYYTQILKWDTEKWGEIPADFGRK